MASHDTPVSPAGILIDLDGTVFRGNELIEGAREAIKTLRRMGKNILGKALGGGVFPISCIAADREILGVFNPGSHGSTFGGNPLACAVSIASLEVLEDEKLADRSLELGEYFKSELESIDSPVIKEVRGRGLFIGVELTEAARPYCERLKEEGLLCKETHDTVIRFAPPLIISKEDLDWAIEKIKHVLRNA